MKILADLDLEAPRKRRLRKKLRVGEFREYGLHFGFTLDESKIDFDTALNQWIDFVERQSWGFGGGGMSDQISGFVTQFSRGSLTDKDQAALKTWFEAQAWIKTFTVGDLVDAWHG